MISCQWDTGGDGHHRIMAKHGWALNRCFAWTFGTVAVLAQRGGGGLHSFSLFFSFSSYVLLSPKNGRSKYLLERLTAIRGGCCWCCGAW